MLAFFRVQKYPYVQQVPYYAPLEIGEYISILDGNYVEHVGEIRNDSLNPWNKKNHKTKQHSFIVNPLNGICRRADTREDRELSNAKEYYGKHPDQKVVKRVSIFVTILWVVLRSQK